MAATQRKTRLQPDAAPIWLPSHDIVVVDQAAARPPDLVQGYTLQDRLKSVFLGTPWKIATTAATLLAVVLFVATVPSLFGAGLGGLIKLAFYQSWTLAIMLAVTAQTRSVSVGQVAKYWLVGFFSVTMIAFFVNGPLSSLASPSAVWVTPILEELLKAAPLGVAVYLGRRIWRQPGLSDLMVLGFAIGGGYAFHESALWEQAAVSGFEANAGLFVPSIFQPDGLFVVGQAVWTSIIGLALGLLLLQRHQAAAVVGAVVAILATIGDHMSINDAEGTLSSIRQLLFNGKLVALIFLGGVAAAVMLDQRRQAATAARDHLFPSDRSHGTHDVDDTDLLKPILAGRYRRLRNGVHNTVDGTMQQWPPRSEAQTAPIAELARLGRAADVAVGPGTSSSGWAADPDAPTRFRFIGPNGFTAYSAGDAIIAPVPVPVLAPAHDDGEIDEDTRVELERQHALVAKEAADLAAVGPTTVTITTPTARPAATGQSTLQRPAEYLQYMGLGVVAVGLFVLVRLLTAGDATTAVIDTVLSLPDAANSPALIRGLLGATAAAVAIRGRDLVVVGPGWDVGPGDDPSPDRPDECEA